MAEIDDNGAERCRALEDDQIAPPRVYARVSLSRNARGVFAASSPVVSDVRRAFLLLKYHQNTSK